MKRRDFFAAAGVGVGAIVAGRSLARAAGAKAAEKRLQVYKCEKCGAIVEVLMPGTASLMHCGRPMTLLVEQTSGAMAPKHVPVIEKIDGGYKVKVGAVAHPMLKTHYIEWIELVADGKACRQFLEPGGKPEAIFMTTAEKVCARALCNLHGLWKS